jgi:hypothetical protein
MIQRPHAFVSIRAEAIRLQKSLTADSQETGYGEVQIVAAKGIPRHLARFAISRTSVVLGLILLLVSERDFSTMHCHDDGARDKRLAAGESTSPVFDLALASTLNSRVLESNLVDSRRCCGCSKDLLAAMMQQLPLEAFRRSQKFIIARHVGARHIFRHTKSYIDSMGQGSLAGSVGFI